MISLSIALSLGLVNLSLESQMESVAHQNLGDARSVLLHLPHPPVHPLKAPFVGDVIHQEDSLGTARVTSYDCTEPALPRGVPYL